MLKQELISIVNGLQEELDTKSNENPYEYQTLLKEYEDEVTMYYLSLILLQSLTKF